MKEALLRMTNNSLQQQTLKAMEVHPCMTLDSMCS